MQGNSPPLIDPNGAGPRRGRRTEIKQLLVSDRGAALGLYYGVGKECACGIEADVSRHDGLGLVGGDGGARSEAEAAYSWFYQGEYVNVARSVFLIVHDRQRAEDIAQDAFVALFAHWPKVRRYDRPDAWVRRVAIRMAVRFLRRESGRDAVERAAVAPVGDSPVDMDLLRAIAALPPVQRVAVVLYYYEDRPVAEIGEMLGSSVGAVKMALARSRRTLGQLLAEEVDDADVRRR